MSKRRRLIVMCVVVILIVIILFVVLYNVLPYKCNYFKEIGIRESTSVSECIDCLGEPNKIENVSEKYPGGWCWWMVYYDDLTLYYRAESGVGLFRIDITGSQYEFGWRKVHIGMTRSEIEKIYKNNEQINCKEHEFGVIEGKSFPSWRIFFKFDEDDILQMITMGFGF
ncbi:MAG: hypothetical protein K2N01_03170 [Lachnospiraceae bacterium]|nr:hypothetical protein [Lachnospiraceae bacterium]